MKTTILVTITTIFIAICIILAIILGYSAIIWYIIQVIKKIKKSLQRKQNNESTSGNYQAQKSKTTTYYSTGYKWNEKTQLWEPPGYQSDDVHVKRNGPTYEEWKAAQDQWKAPKQDPNGSDSTYSFKSSELPKDEAKIPPKQPAQQATSKPKQAEEAPRQTYHTWSTGYNQPKTDPKPVEPTPPKSEYQGAYRAASVLTANESHNYKVLKAAADRKGYTISVKMRLADLVTPTASKYDRKNYMSHFGKIKSKHVDFVVFDQYMRPKAIIELDDNSHDRKDRQERDKFVDSILMDAGYKVIHTRYIQPDILDNI